MMTPAHDKKEKAESIADSQRTGRPGVQNGDGEESKGFMAGALSRLKKKDKEPNSSPAAEDEEDGGKRKSRILLGKKILGGLS